MLVEELGLDPSPVVTDVERRILNHDPTLMLAEPGGVPLRGYRLGERLGTGRDDAVLPLPAPVWSASSPSCHPPQDVADDPEFVRSFEATAHRVASLRHPAVVADPRLLARTGRRYVVMRRLPGGTLGPAAALAA